MKATHVTFAILAGLLLTACATTRTKAPEAAPKQEETKKVPEPAPPSFKTVHGKYVFAFLPDGWLVEPPNLSEDPDVPKPLDAVILMHVESGSTIMLDLLDTEGMPPALAAEVFKRRLFANAQTTPITVEENGGAWFRYIELREGSLRFGTFAVKPAPPLPSIVIVMYGIWHPDSEGIMPSIFAKFFDGVSFVPDE